MSYRKKHIQHNIHKTTPKVRIIFRPSFWISLASFILVGSIMYIVFFYPGFKINTLVVSGNSTISTEALEQASYAILERPLWQWRGVSLFSKNIIFLKPKILARELEQRFPGIKNITILKKFPQTVAISVTERLPKAIYCDAVEQCFYIDSDGIIFEKVSFASNAYSRIYKTPNTESTLSDVAVEGYIVQKIDAIGNMLEDSFEISIAEAVLENNFKLTLTTSEGWKVYYTIDTADKMHDQNIRLRLLLTEKIDEQERKNLRYIDLRFAERAYYK